MNMKKFIKEHKKEFTIGYWTVAACVAGVGLYKLGRHTGIDYALEHAEIKWDLSGVCNTIARDEDQWWIGRNGIALTDMGKLGEDIREAIPDMSENVIISAVMIPTTKTET